LATQYYLFHMELFRKKIYFILPCYMTWKQSKGDTMLWKTSIRLRLWKLEAKYIVRCEHKQLAFHCTFPHEMKPWFANIQLAFHCTFPHEMKPWFANICDSIACLKMLSPTTLLPQLVKIMIPLTITQDHKMIYGGINGNAYM